MLGKMALTESLPDGDHKLEGESEFMKITHGVQCGFETPSSTNGRKKNKGGLTPKLTVVPLCENQFMAAM